MSINLWILSNPKNREAHHVVARDVEEGRVLVLFGPQQTLAKILAFSVALLHNHFKTSPGRDCMHDCPVACAQIQNILDSEVSVCVSFGAARSTRI